MIIIKFFIRFNSIDYYFNLIYLQMKKHYLLAAMMLLSSASFFSSCNKDKDDDVDQKQQVENKENPENSSQQQNSGNTTKPEDQKPSENPENTENNENQNPSESGKTEKEEETVLISFDLNGVEGTAPSDVKAVVNSAVELPVVDIAGYVFKGWAKTSKGEVVTDFTTDKNTTLYAVFSNVVRCKYEDIPEYLEAYAKENRPEMMYFIIEGNCGLNRAVDFPEKGTDNYSSWKLSAGGRLNSSASFEVVESLCKYSDIPLTFDFSNTNLKYLPREMFGNYEIGAEIKVILPNTLEFLYKNFSNCKRINEITIPKSVKIILDAFGYCSNLKKVNFEKDSQLEIISNDAFKQSGLTEFTLPKSVVELGNGAFNDCGSLKKFNFEEGTKLKTIGIAVFEYAGVESFTIPKSVTTIGDYAFYSYDLKTVTFEAGSQLKTMGNNCFFVDTKVIGMPK